jgi:hypothetical protein
MTRTAALESIGFDIRRELPALVPRAIAWAEEQARIVLQFGRPLHEPFISIARCVGVVRPERIRILDVRQIPIPDDPLLQDAATATELIGRNMAGLTLGYAVFACHGHGESIRLLSHEFRHVYQYEQAGSIAAFLPTYIDQIVSNGYQNAALEVDARIHEISEV